MTDAAAPAEADRADIVGGVGARDDRRDGAARPGDDVVRLERADHVARLVLVGRRAADGAEVIDRDRGKARDRKPARDVLDVRVQAAVLVHDDDGGEFLPVLRLGEIALEPRRAARDVDHLGDEARIALRDGLGPGVVVLEQRQQRGCGGGPAGDRGETVEEGAAGQAAMGVAIEELDDALVHGPLPDAEAGPY